MMVDASSRAGTQILTLSGLRFDAKLGILEAERNGPQPIQVDAELNQGTQPLRTHDEPSLMPGGLRWYWTTTEAA